MKHQARVIAVAVVAVGLVAAGLWFFRNRTAAPAAQANGPAKPPAPKAPRKPIVFAIAPAVDGHFDLEPCLRMRGAGLSSWAAYRDQLVKSYPTVAGYSMGDLSPVPGEIGRQETLFAIGAVLVQGGVPGSVQSVAAGPAELQHGIQFARELSDKALRVCCANATDAQGVPLFTTYSLADAGGRTVLFVPAVSETLQAELAARGSDIVLRPAREAVAEAVRQGEAKARSLDRVIDVRILALHGTEDETAEMMKSIPGWTFAIAGRGGALPTQPFREVDGVPLYYAGRAMRFTLGVLLTDDAPPAAYLLRFGVQAHENGNPLEEAFQGHADFMADYFVPSQIAPEDKRSLDPRGAYAGAARCATAGCHAEIAEQHRKSPHARATGALKDRGAKGRTSCLSCHATGAFARAGWRGPEDASDLATVSCEACHGPGAAHADAAAAGRKDASGYGRGVLAKCRTCHEPDRTPNFDPEALWKTLGHGGR